MAFRAQRPWFAALAVALTVGCLGAWWITGTRDLSGIADLDSLQSPTRDPDADVRRVDDPEDVVVASRGRSPKAVGTTVIRTADRTSARIEQRATLTRKDVKRWIAELKALQDPVFDRLANETASSGEVLTFNQKSRKHLKALVRLIGVPAATQVLQTVPMYRVRETSRTLHRIDALERSLGEHHADTDQDY